MIAVSDTSPLNYLILIELQDILPKLFDRIVIPEAVHRELQSPAAPDPIKRFVTSVPSWLEVRAAPQIADALRHLDSGEQEAIALAEALAAQFVLLDERKGRQTARAMGLAVAGTLSLIQRAAQCELLDLADALKRLEATNFRASQRLLTRIRSET